MFSFKDRKGLLPLDVDCSEDKRFNFLRNSLYHTFRTIFLPYFPVDIYKKYFDAERGRKTKDVQSMLGLFVLQALWDMTDWQAQEAFMFDERIRYALDISEKDAFLSLRSFYYYKNIFVGSEAEIFKQVLNKILNKFEFEYSLQRTDSSLIRQNLKNMSEWELFKTTLVKCLREIKKKFPNIFKEIPQQLQRYLQENDNNTWFADFTPSKAQDYLLQAAKDALSLKETFANHPEVSKLVEFKLVLRLINERVTVEEGQITVGLKQHCKGSAMVNPHDPDAQYSGHKKDVGYKVSISETCAANKETPNPKLITDVQVEQANVSDIDILESSIDAREQKGVKPDTELTDNGFESDANHQALKDKKVDLVSPPSGQPVDGIGIMDFKFNEDGQSVKSCPAGQSCIENRINKKFEKTSSYFKPEQCRVCPYLQECPIKIAKRKAKIQWQWKTPRLQARRQAFAQDQATIDLFRQRAGGEAVFSQLKVNHGLDRLSTRGYAKAKFKVFMAAVALNIKRVFNWCASQGSSASKIQEKGDSGLENSSFTDVFLFYWLFLLKFVQIFRLRAKSSRQFF